MNEQPNNATNEGEGFWEKVIGDPHVRREVTRKNLLMFFNVYCPEDIKYDIAPFQKEVFGILQDQAHRFVVIEAFRGSAKTTIVNKTYGIWAVVGEQQKKNVLIIAQTQEQARYYLTNIKGLMLRDPLRSDMGPFEELSNEWRINTIVIPKYDARITIASVDQPIRGLLHGSYRPDLIICDDLESVNSVKSPDIREKLYSWFTSDILPLGDLNTRTIVVGTRLHEESIIMKLKEDIEEGRRDGIVRSYPIIDIDKNILWPGKYPNMEAVDKERMRIGNDDSWRQEYMLELVPEGSQVVPREWIQYYDEMPNNPKNHVMTITAVDPALSEAEKSDFSAIVSAEVFMYDWELRIYIHRDPVNQKMKYPELLDRITLISKSLGKGWSTALVFEDVAFQKAGIQDLQARGFYVIPFRPGATDKRTRLAMASPLIKLGKVLFPREGAEELVDQIVYFPNVKHDDLVDALTMLVLQVMLNVREGKPEVIRLF